MFGKWDSAEFFSTGGREAERVLAMCRSNAVNVSYGKLLDFGCAVGRMTRAFSGYFRSCAGIDISQNIVSLYLTAFVSAEGRIVSSSGCTWAFWPVVR
jgi:cyclopropane fatty-acyl-phospholipid synthase-like methyltransferase